MKLAEALSIRKSLADKMVDIKDRLYNVARIPEGDKPIEDPETLIEQLSAVAIDLKHIIFVINKTNLTITDENGTSMTQLLAKRDVMKGEIDVLKGVFSQATSQGGRYSRQELKYVPALDVTKLQQKIARMSKEYRELDMKVQTLNFSCDVLENADQEYEAGAVVTD